MVKLTQKQWDSIKNKYVPQHICEEIERDNFIAGIKGEKTTLKISIPAVTGNEYKEVPAEKLSEYWFITPSHEKGFSLSHKEGVAMITNVKTRKAILTLWEKLSDFNMELSISKLSNQKYFYDIRDIVNKFRNTGK